MLVCPSCGRENPDDARFCNACGGPLATAAAVLEQRKVVTVLFCDLVGSTALGESTDPEALRARMRRYFEDLRAIVERHGGVVEKFVGDAVMAVFGIPVSHEDDALRAVRAASEMRAAVAEHGLEARIGVNTGEVVVGREGETLVTGDAVNIAARLEQAAPPGEALIGAETRLLVRDAVCVEPVEPLTLKGKAQPVEAYRLLEVLEGAAPLARHLETPLVGRKRERERVWRDFEDAVADRTCRLFTLLGPAGIGKSRLVADFLERVGDSADVLRGRCLSYGEGITYWPLVEILLAIRVEPEAVIGTSPAETQLAFRRLLEARAAERPQVVVVDDLQWAEPVFVDLVEHVADFSRDAPIFLLCVARTELLDIRPGWGGGKVNAASLLLEPLGAEECDALMEQLAGDAALNDELRERIATASAGNPLYVEEMLAMVREHGGEGEVAVPPTIHALLQARIDSLENDVRVVMERGAVEGEVFHRGAVSVLAPDPVRDGVEEHLSTLVRKELIRSTSPIFPDDEGFRFRHLLIRDAAYESLPKATRAELHERFADWLSTQELVERDEIVGYHLEQAHRYRSELDPEEQALAALATRAGERLWAAGTGALARGDWRAGRTLMLRAHRLFPEGDRRRGAVGVEVSYVLAEAGETVEANEVLAAALTSPDPVLRARGKVAEFEVSQLLGGRASEPRKAEREEARAVLEAAGDDVGLARYWWSVGYDGWAACRAEQALASWERGRRHAEAAGAQGLARELESRVPSCLILGPTPVGEALERAESIARRATGAPLLEAFALQAVGMLRAMEGDVDDGRQLVQRGWRTIADSGQVLNAAGNVQRMAFIERRAGDRDAERRVEDVLRRGFEELERLDDRSYLPTVALDLAHCLVCQGRDEDARALCELARERTLPVDTVNFIYLDGTDALLAARQGRLAEAEALARRGWARAETTDFFTIRGMRALGILAEVLSVAGKPDEAMRTGIAALAEHERKGDVSGVAALRERLAQAGVELP
jgi:class 3 adenylate cyclase